MTLRIYLLSPVVQFAARVNQLSATYPLDEIPYNTVTAGSYSLILPGMTLLLGSAAGLDDYGRQRIRAGATTTVIKVGRSSNGTGDGELDVVDNAYITILQDYRVWAKIPFIDGDGDIHKDSDLTAGTYLVNPPPKANGGVGFAGTIDSVTGLLTVSFSGSASYQFDPALSSALASVTSYQWNVVDGTITVGTGTSAAITATFPAGFRWVNLVVFNSVGYAHTHHIPVFARDPDDDDSFTEFQIVRHSDTAHGQEIDVRVLADIPRSTYPDGTLAMIWEDEPATPSDRTHMIFIGWHQGDEAGAVAQRTATLRDTTLHLVDVAGRLKTLPGFPQVIDGAGTSKWTQTLYPNVFYYLWYLLHWHSTALDVADLLLGTQVLNNFAFKILSSDADTLFNQVNGLANNVTPDHHLTCNWRGQLLLVVDPIIQNFVDRAPGSLDDLLDDGDWIEFHFGYQRPPRVHWLRSFAIAGGSAEIIALASLAPGDAPGQGAQYIESSERITAGQFDLNNVEGNRYARMNAPYGPFTIVIPYASLQTFCDPAYMGWVWLLITSGKQPQRTLAAAEQRGIVHEITIAYDYQRTGLIRTVTLTWELETFGPPAKTLVLEAEEVL